MVLLTLGTGYCVAAEFAFVAVRRTRLEERAQAGDAKAVRALRVLGRLSFMLSGAQLGITVTTLVTGFVAEPVLATAIRPLLEAAGVPAGATYAVSLGLGLVLATVLSMVLGELAPKNLAIARAEGISRSLAGSVLALLAVFGPVIRFFDSSATRLLRRLGVEIAEELHGGAGPAELEVIVEESESSGHLSLQQSARLRRALDFRELHASDVMVPRTSVVTVRADAPVSELGEALESGHSRFPVVGGGVDEIVGVVHALDLLAVTGPARAGTTAGRLARPGALVPEALPLFQAVELLREAQNGLAVVVDEYGGFAGVLTAEDVLEELLGEVGEGPGAEGADMAQQPDGSVVIPGLWRLHEVERDLGLELPEGPYETVAGLILARLGRLARVGDEVGLDVPEVLLRVEAVDRHAITSVRVRAREPLPDIGPDDPAPAQVAASMAGS